MKIVNVNEMNKMDHDDIKDNSFSENQRKQARLKIINNFVSWSSKTNLVKKLKGENDEDFKLLKKQTTFFNLLSVFGFFSNFFIYQAFFTGIYNYRQTELINMRRIPFPVKLLMSSFFTGNLCHLLYRDNIYDD